MLSPSLGLVNKRTCSSVIWDSLWLCRSPIYSWLYMFLFYITETLQVNIPPEIQFYLLKGKCMNKTWLLPHYFPCKSSTFNGHLSGIGHVRWKMKVEKLELIAPYILQGLTACEVSRKNLIAHSFRLWWTWASLSSLFAHKHCVQQLDKMTHQNLYC